MTAGVSSATSGAATKTPFRLSGSQIDMLSKFSDMFSEAANDRMNKDKAKAYQGYLDVMIPHYKNSLEARAEKYDQKLQDMFHEAEPQFQEEAGTQLPELKQLIEDIAYQNAIAQRQNKREVEAALASQGVRGGQAAILSNRATGELNRNLQSDINQTAYNEALNRQNSRLNYYGQKALTPWHGMQSAYTQSMVGANNSLSNAEGNILEFAGKQGIVNAANLGGGKGSKLMKIGSGILSGATTGAAMSGGNPWGAAIGGAAGGAMAAFS